MTSNCVGGTAKGVGTAVGTIGTPGGAKPGIIGTITGAPPGAIIGGIPITGGGPGWYMGWGTGGP